jgi:hypothetical protein
MKRLFATTPALLLAFAAPLLHDASAAPLLSVDVNDREVADTPNTVNGFLSFTMAGTAAASSALETQILGGYTVTIQAFDDGLDENTVTAGIQNAIGQIDDRDRATPLDAGALTYGQIYDDIIFAGTSTGPTGGLNLSISGGALLPNTPYSFSLYAFDSGSTAAPQPRTANWLDGNSGSSLIFSTSFSGAALPTTNDQYRFTGTAMTDSSGTLLLLGRNTTPNAASGATSIGVFINGFEVEAVPEPTAVLALGFAGMAALGLRRRRR